MANNSLLGHLSGWNDLPEVQRLRLRRYSDVSRYRFHRYS